MRSYAAAKPSEVAKPTGMPNNVIVTCPEVVCACIASEPLWPTRGASAHAAPGKGSRPLVRRRSGEGGGRLTSMRWCRTSWIQACRCSLRLQSRQSRGAGPTRSGCNSTLTWRGFEVVLPFHWHCSRSGQGRQLRMLAPYTMRRLPSASLRCSCGVSFWSAGHRSVPSGWRAKSWPAKRPAFHAEPTSGGA